MLAADVRPQEPRASRCECRGEYQLGGLPAWTRETVYLVCLLRSRRTACSNVCALVPVCAGFIEDHICLKLCSPTSGAVTGVDNLLPLYGVASRE